MPDKTVFISYNHSDSYVADKLKAALEAAGICVRIDKAVVDAGENFQEFIENSVRDTDVTLSLVSNHSLESAWVAMETITAFYNEKLQSNKKFIACYIDDDFFKPVFRINATKRIDAKIKKIEGYIRAQQTLRTDTKDLNSQVDMLYALRNNLGSILKRLRESLTLDIREDKFDESISIILRTIGQSSPSPTKRREIELEIVRKFLLDLSDSEKYTPLGGSAQKKNIQMETVFEHKPFQLEPMSEGDRKQFETRQIHNAVREILQIRRAVLLGEPGSGKTTTLYKLTAELCQKALEDEDAPIPLLVPLGKWDDDDQPLDAFIKKTYPDLAEFFDQMLTDKRAALLLDGLNEIRVGQRDNKYKQVESFINVHRELIAIVSCRELDYPRDKIDLKCDRINILPLDPIRIRRFVTNYLDKEKGETLFWKLAGLNASDAYERFIDDMKDKLTEPEQVFWTEPELPSGIKWSWFKDDNWRWEEWVKNRENPTSMMVLANNPFMLTMLTGVYAEQNELPKNRGDLFKSFIEKLLKREKVPADEQRTLIDGLARVAFEMQIRRTDGDGEQSASTVLPLENVKTILGDHHVYLAASTNILSPGDPVRFTHQLLQEYFAAKYMDIEISEGRLTATEIWKPDRWWERTNWEEAAILLAGLYNNDCSKIVNWIAEANPEVAAMCVDRSGAKMDEITSDQLRKQWLLRMTDLRKEPNPKARAAVGRALGTVNWDDRKGVGNTEVITEADQKILLPDIDWVEIQGSEFQYGDESEYAAKPQKLTIPTFFISRYPITYAQFYSFLKDPEGYQNRQWFEGLAADEDDRRMSDQSFEFFNHPRETVNWYQAIAFCRWFSWRLGSTYDLKKISKWAVRLPTEFEWEKAARGTDARLYPYKGKFSAKKANTHQTGIGQTSAVGLFPNGASPYGVMDMSGNVWEWCLSDYNKPALDLKKENLRTNNTRVLRGGSWDDDHVSARAVYRNLDNPVTRYVNVGFRVVGVVRPPSL